MMRREKRFVSISDTLTLSQLEDADQLQFRGDSWQSGLIKMSGRGEHSHSAKFCWINGIPFVVEVKEWIGGRAVTLESQVKLYNGRIDVFKTNPYHIPAYNRKGAMEYMLRMAGTPYGWSHIKTASLCHLAGFRLLNPTNLDDDEVPTGPPFCSEATALADRLGGGLDPVPHLADSMTYPADLTRSNFYSYLFTLVL